MTSSYEPEKFAGATGYVNATTTDEVIIEGLFRPTDVAEFTANTPVFIFTTEQLDDLVDAITHGG